MSSKVKDGGMIYVDTGQRHSSARQEERDLSRPPKGICSLNRVNRTPWDLSIVIPLAFVTAAVITSWNRTNNLAAAPVQNLETIPLSAVPLVSYFANGNVCVDADHQSGPPCPQKPKPYRDSSSFHPTRNLLHPLLRTSCRLAGTLTDFRTNVTESGYLPWRSLLVWVQVSILVLIYKVLCCLSSRGQ